MITNLRMELFEALVSPEQPPDVLLCIVSCSGTITFNYQSWRHAAAAWHGTTQTAVNNSEGFMIGDHMYCIRYTSGVFDVWYEGTKSYHFDNVQCNKYDHKSQVTVSPVSQNVVSPCRDGLLSSPLTFRGHICDHLCGNCHLLQIFWPRQEICRKTETCQF